MTSSHLNFDQLSDMIDGDLSESTLKEYQSHLDSCMDCRLEYETLKKCLSLVQSVKTEKIEIPDLCRSTIELYDKRTRRKIFSRRLPAIAASMLIVAGTGFTLSQSNFFAGNNYIAADENLSNTEKIISFIRNSDGTILKMTDKYIDSQISSSSLHEISNSLSKNNLKLKIYNRPFYQVSNIQNKNYSDVSAGNSGKVKMDIEKISPNKDGKIIIRIFK